MAAMGAVRESGRGRLRRSMMHQSTRWIRRTSRISPSSLERRARVSFAARPRRVNQRSCWIVWAFWGEWGAGGVGSTSSVDDGWRAAGEAGTGWGDKGGRWPRGAGGGGGRGREGCSKIFVPAGGGADLWGGGVRN